MNVAVTGAAGYIGGWLCRELRTRGHDVHAQDILRGDLTDCDTFAVFDLATAERAKWLRRIKPDVVIHLAALYGRVWGDVDMTKTAAVNAGLTGALARDSAACGARLLFASSSEVYGDSAHSGTAYSPLTPRNMYGLSKKWGEEAARVYAPDGLVITRLNMPYGPAATSPQLGETPKTSGRPGTLGYNVLHSMVWEAAHGMDLTVHRDTERCFTWVGDTVRGIAVIMESGQPGIWNVSRNDQHIQIIDLARRITAITGSTSVITEESTPSSITPRKSLDNSALLALGWRPHVHLDEGIKLSWEYFRCFDRDGVWRGDTVH